MNIEEMKRIMTLYFQATNEKDGSLIIDYVADEVIWHEGFAGADGSDVIIKATKQEGIAHNIMGAGSFPDRIKTINFQIAEGDKVFTYFTVEGTHLDDFMGHPPIGKHIRYNAIYTARFENGLIVEMWALMDGVSLLKQISAIT